MKMKKKGHENDVKVKMRWKLLNQDAKRGTQKEEGRRKHQHMKPSPKRANPGKTREKKSEGRRTRNKTSGGGGRTDVPEPTYQSETYTYPGTRRTQPTWREENARTHEKRDLWGTSWWRCIHINMQIPLVEAHRPKYHVNPMDSLRRQTLNYVHNWTSPTTIKRKNHHTCKHVLVPPHGSISCCKKSSSIPLGQYWKTDVVAASSYAEHGENWKKAMPSTAAGSFNTHSTDRVRPERWTAVSLHLDELLIQKCKFRDRFNVPIFSLERLSPRGSCHLDEAGMKHTLAQKYLIELLMWNASSVQQHPS